MQQEADVIQDLDGNAVAGAAVTVIDKTTGELAALFADNETTPISNPVYTDANARYAFKAKNGKYKTTVSIGGKSFKGKDDLLLYDPADDADRVTAASLAADDGSSKVVFTQSGEGAVPRPVEEELRERVSVMQFGAKGDGVTDDTAAIHAAIDKVGTAGGGVVLFPAGVYVVSNANPGAASWDDYVAIWIKHSNVNLIGAGIGATRIKLADGANAHAIKIGQRMGAMISPQNCSVSGMEIDGNRANQITPTADANHFSGIDVASGSYRTILRDLYVHDTQYYGVSFQVQDFRNCLIDSILITNTGADGVDFKDYQGNNRSNRIRNVTVRAFGLVSQDILPVQCGIGVRGGVSVSHVEVTDFAGDRHGIRVDPNPSTQNSVVGPITDFHVVAAAKDETIGVYVNGFPAYVTSCRVQNGTVIGANCGVDMRSPEGHVANVRAQGCGTGIQVLTRSMVSECYTYACTVSGYTIRDDANTLTNVYAYNNAVGATIEAASSSSSIRGGSFANTLNISDAGAQTAISQVTGINTDTVVTASVDVATTGAKTVDVAHSLHFTPDIDYITTSIKRDTSVNDYVITGVRVNAVSATNVNCTVFVGTASATAGAKATLCIRSIAKKAVRY